MTRSPPRAASRTSSTATTAHSSTPHGALPPPPRAIIPPMAHTSSLTSHRQSPACRLTSPPAPTATRALPTKCISTSPTTGGKAFKGHGEVKITKAGKSLSLIFECVRREEDWKAKFIDRMRLYKDFLENFVQFDSGFEARPQLILVCEDDKHMVETFKEVVKKGMQFENIKVYYTTDLKQNAESLEKSLTEFTKNETTGKFEAKNIEFKILE